MNMELKTYDSVIAAKYLLALAYKKGIVLNVTKVQKILYIAYGYFLSKYEHPIVNEQPRAWPFGPVFPRTRKKVEYNIIIEVSNPIFDEIRQNEELTTKFDSIIDKYSPYSASQLSEWSHSVGSPWYQSTKLNGFNWNQAIPDLFIQSYFKEFNV